MLGWFYRLMPREERFFDMFEKHATCLTDGSKALRDMLDGGPRVKEFCQKVGAYEHQADLVTAEVYEAVRRSFITPFDRSDIRGLVTSMDDAIDQMNATAKTITLYEITAFEQPMRDMSGIIVEAARITAEAMPLLRSIGSNGNRLHDLTERLVRIEGHADDIHDAGLKALFKAHADKRPMDFLIGRELYSHLEKVVDKFEDVANEIQGLVIDHA